MNIAHQSSVPATAPDKQTTSTPPFLSRLIMTARTNDIGIALGLLILCFATRLIAVPASLWEWDDILFARALHRYDLIAHSPHPPGFPVFVAMARAAFWALHDEHRALTTVALIFASLLAPALFFFYREVFQDKRIAFAGALLGSFAPNVWTHSGAGRSDTVAMTLGVIGLALVINGLRSRRSLIAGCALFGLAMGVRVTLLPVMGPVIALVLIARLRRHEWKLVSLALAAGTVCALIWFAPLIYHVTWKTFRFTMDLHSQYTFRTDTMFSNTENGVLQYRLTRFFVEIWGAPWIMWTIYALSVLGLIALASKRQWRVIGWMALSFLPFMAFVLTLNTPLSAPLYSLPYIPFFTGLAACGLVKTPDLIPRSEWWRARKNLGLFLAAGLTIGMAGWAYPIIMLIHRQESPPIRAINYLKKKIDARRDALDFSGIFTPHVSLYFPQIRRITLDKIANTEANLLNPVITQGRIYGFTDVPVLGGSGEAFHWDLNNLGMRRLKILSLGRYFDAYITDVTNTRRVMFLSGWYPEESYQGHSWRWTRRRAKVALLNVADSMILQMRGSVARTASDKRPTVTFRLNGVEIGRTEVIGDAIDHNITVKTDPRFLWYTFTIEIDQTVNPSKAGKSNDPRDLGVRCDSLQWFPAPGAKYHAFNPNQFLGPGWFGLEGDEYNRFRWAEQDAAVYLPPIEGDGHLELTMHTPTHPDGSVSSVAVKIDGNVIDRVQSRSGWTTQTIRIPEAVHRRMRAELVLSADKSVILPNGDNRRVGMQVFQIIWRPGE